MWGRATVVQATRAVKPNRPLRAARVFFRHRHHRHPLVSEPPSSRPLRAHRSGSADKTADRPGDRPWEKAGDKRSLFDRLVEFVSPGPDSKAELIKLLATAEQRDLIEPESRQML